MNHEVSEAKHPELPRSLGLRDLILLNIVAILNLNLVPVAAAGGFSAIGLWIAALLMFFLPQGIAVAEFSTRYPQEGGIYLWTRKLFGDTHGFISGWCYWTNNIFYIPTLLLYLVGIAVFVGGPEFIALADNRVFVFVLSLTLLWAFTALNVLGLGVGKWVNNLGGIGATGAALVLLGVAALAFSRSGGQGFAELPGVEALFPSWSDWRTVSAFSVICFGLVGLELASVMGDEVRDPRRNISRAVLIGGIACGVLYLAATVSLLAALPVGELSVVQGILQAFERLGELAGVALLIAPLAFILTLSIAGATSAWLAGSARIPFVAGLDRYLPEALGRVHPRWRTPHVALITHATASSAFIAMSFIGAGVRDAYLTLLELAVVLQLVPFVYLFLGLFRVAGHPGGHYRSKPLLQVAGIAGLGATLLALVTAFVPPATVDSPLQYEVKMILGTALFVGFAALLPRYRRVEGKPAAVTNGLP
ncbi:MAG: APC family permease [Vicinamibacteria bacterium]